MFEEPSVLLSHRNFLSFLVQLIEKKKKKGQSCDRLAIKSILFDFSIIVIDSLVRFGWYVSIPSVCLSFSLFLSLSLSFLCRFFHSDSQNLKLFLSFYFSLFHQLSYKFHTWNTHIHFNSSPFFPSLFLSRSLSFFLSSRFPSSSMARNLRLFPPLSDRLSHFGSWICLHSRGAFIQVRILQDAQGS